MPIRRLLRVSCLVLTIPGCAYYHEPPGGQFQKLSQIAHFPDFYPGLGTLYVQPDTMPIGPYYSYDRRGRLVNTIYMGTWKNNCFILASFHAFRFCEWGDCVVPVPMEIVVLYVEIFQGRFRDLDALWIVPPIDVAGYI
jgi:hypothetical protein